jgi:hypothetical protein
MFLYTDRSQEWVTVPSRSIEDIELPEQAYKADFELGNRYQELLKELVRFSLLGITGYAFLIKEILGETNMGIIASGPKLIIVIVGLFCFACCAGLGLYCRELNNTCLRMQTVILRLLQRLGTERWTNPDCSSPEDVKRWRDANTEDLTKIRYHQKQNLVRAYYVLRLAVWLLIFGIVFTAAVFVMCLQARYHPLGG